MIRFLLFPLLAINLSCSRPPAPQEEYVLVEFAAKLEEETDQIYHSNQSKKKNQTSR